MSKSILKRTTSKSNLKVQKHVVFKEMVSVGYTHHPDNYDRSVIETSHLTKKDIEEILKMREEMHRETQRLVKKQREIEMQIFARREEESKRIASFKLAQLQKRMAKELRFQMEVQGFQNVLNQPWALYQPNGYYPQATTMPSTPSVYTQPPSPVQNNMSFSLPMVQKSFPAFRPSSPVLPNQMFNTPNMMPNTLPPTPQSLYSYPVNPYQNYYYGEMMAPKGYNMLVPESVM
jgi:hypothetical protein